MSRGPACAPLPMDFILKRGAVTTPVECKAALAVNRKHMRGLVGYLRLHGLKSGYLVSLAPCGTDSLDDVEVVNLPAYLLERFAQAPGRGP